MSSDPYYEAVVLMVGLVQTGLPVGVMAGILTQAVKAQPGAGDVGARAALACCLWEAGEQTEALVQMRQVTRQSPEPSFRRALVVMLEAQGANDEAQAVRSMLDERTPANANFFAARAEVLLRLPSAVGDEKGRADAFALSMSGLTERLSRAEKLLRAGDLDGGLAEFAWRLRDPSAPGIASRLAQGPLERPNPTTWFGRTVLFYGELGHGDMVQCLRFIPMVLESGAEVVLELQPGLVRLAESIPGVQKVVAWGETVPAHDLALPMFHLPWAFCTRLDNIPVRIPYLTADPLRVAAWRTRLEGLPGLKVGLTWAGNPHTVFPQMDLMRSVPLATLAPLGKVLGVSLVSLQKGVASQAAPPAGMVLYDWTDELSDFADTAALMEALDLVVTVDTACVHLAGALGRPVWLLNRFDSCWRWLEGRDDSPWYPTLRQFRQGARGDWVGVVMQVALALQKLVRFA
jgi:hypothetical protein